jgi:drug/metabolite transporter (DMT)-like permease
MMRKGGDSGDNALLLPSSNHKPKPSVWFVHACLAAIYALAGFSTVIIKLGVSGINPVLFALLRDTIAGPLLVIIAYIFDGELLRPRDWPPFVAPGFFLFIAQFLFVVGSKIASPVTAAAWQPATPIFTAIFATALGMERVTPLKTFGILISVAGALFMVFFRRKNNNTKAVHDNEALGNILMLMEVTTLSVFVISSRALLKRFKPCTVTAYCYMWAAAFMWVAGLVIDYSETCYDFVCQPDCRFGKWEFPAKSVFSLVWYILVISIGCYCLLTWANNYIEASKVCLR